MLIRMPFKNWTFDYKHTFTDQNPDYYHALNSQRIQIADGDWGSVLPTTIQNLNPELDCLIKKFE